MTLFPTQYKLIAVGVMLLAFTGLVFKVRFQAAELKEVKMNLATAEESFSLCQLDITKMNEVTSEHIRKISLIDSKLKSMFVRFDAQRIKVNHGSGNSNGAADTGEFCGQNGIDAGELIEFAGDAEKVREKTIELQDYLRDRLNEQ